MLKIRNVLYAVPIIVLVVGMNGMWNEATVYSEDHSVPNSSYEKASDWLKTNLDEDEIAMVPNSFIFNSFQPELGENLLDYKTVWDDAGIILRANTTETEVSAVREQLRQQVEDNGQVKYLLIDWVYPYGTKLFDTRQCSDLDIDMVSQTTSFDFTQPHAKWKSRITVCQVQHTN